MPHPTHAWSLSWLQIRELAARQAAGESLVAALTELAARYSERHLWQVSGENYPDGSLRQQLCLWPDEAVVVAAVWKELRQERIGSANLRPWARRVRVEAVTLTSVLDHDSAKLEKILAPLGESLARLPPYTDDEIAAIAREQGQPEQAPERVWAWVDFDNIPLLLGQDEDGTAQVRFPAAWPAGPYGRNDWHAPWSYSDWREERQLGAAARPHNWAVPVRRVGSDGCVRWGMIDLEGRFILPCEYGYLSGPEIWFRKDPPPLPAGRQAPWLWVGARRAPLELPADLETAAKPTPLPLTAAKCDVIEVWSGERVNPPGFRALAGTLNYASFLVCRDEDNASPLLGLMEAGQSHPGPLIWRRIIMGIHNDLVLAQEAASGRWGYIDNRGDTAIPPQYTDARFFNSRIAQVQVTGEDDDPRWGVINETGNWVLAPRWRDIDDEYDGHFMVQAADESWGVVTPEGGIVVPFSATQFTNAIGEWLKTRFKRVQQRRYRQWIKTARAEGSLAVFAGKLHSSYGAYDYGALPTGELAIKVIRSVTVSGEYYAPENSGPREVRLETGMSGRWKPGARHYAHYVDLRIHTIVEIDGLDVHALQVPWDALALQTLPPPEFEDADLAVRLAHLQATAHREALEALINAIEDTWEALHTAAILAREAPTLPADPAKPWTGRFSESLAELENDCDSLRKHLMKLQWLEMCLDRPTDAESFPHTLELLLGACHPVIPVAAIPALESLWSAWIKAYRQ